MKNKLKLLAGIWKRGYIFFLGAAALIWFLIRVLPKPSRASYPCQRAAFPLATAFIIWISGTFLSFKSFKTARVYFGRRKIWLASGLAMTGIIIFFISIVVFPPGELSASGKLSKADIPILQLSSEPQDQYIEARANVSIVKADTDDVLAISKAQIETMVRKAVALAGGLENIISDGDVVVLKPNIVLSKFMNDTLATEANGMVSDWRLVAAVAKIVREINPSGEILVMEGSADSSTTLAYERLKYTKEYIPEVDEFLAIEEVSGDWQDFDSEKLKSVLIPAERALCTNFKMPDGSFTYYYNLRYFMSDVIITLPVLKNHI